MPVSGEPAQVQGPFERAVDWVGALKWSLLAILVLLLILPIGGIVLYRSVYNYWYSVIIHATALDQRLIAALAVLLTVASFSFGTGLLPWASARRRWSVAAAVVALNVAAWAYSQHAPFADTTNARYYWRTPNGLEVTDREIPHPTFGTMPHKLDSEVWTEWLLSKDCAAGTKSAGPLSVEALKTSQFFNMATHLPTKWYYRDQRGKFEWFNCPGVHPTFGKPLAAATPQIIETYLASVEQHPEWYSQKPASTPPPSSPSPPPTPAVSTPPAPAPTVVPQHDSAPYSSGELVVRGTFSCDLDAGAESDDDADFWWEQVDSRNRFVVPKNGARFFVIGKRDFESVDLDSLRRLSYSAERLSGFDGPGNRLATGTVLGAVTSQGRFSKILVESYGENLKISWVTFTEKARGVSTSQVAPVSPARWLVVPLGTSIEVSLAGEIRSDRVREGDLFEVFLTKEVRVGDSLALQADTRGSVTILSAVTDDSRNSTLAFALTGLRLATGQTIRLATNPVTKSSRRSGLVDALIGAGGGAAVGALAGGGKGAVAGAGAGAAGGAIFAGTRPVNPVILDAAQRIKFRLTASALIPLGR